MAKSCESDGQRCDREHHAVFLYLDVVRTSLVGRGLLHVCQWWKSFELVTVVVFGVPSGKMLVKLDYAHSQDSRFCRRRPRHR